MTLIHDRALADLHRFGIEAGVLKATEPIEPAEGESWPAWRNKTDAIWDALAADVEQQAAIVTDTLAVLGNDVDAGHAVARGTAAVLKRLIDAGDRLRYLASVRDAFASANVMRPPALPVSDIEHTLRMISVSTDLQTAMKARARMRQPDPWTPAWLVHLLDLPGVTIKCNSAADQQHMGDLPMLRKPTMPAA